MANTPEKSEHDMKFWTKEMVVEYDKFRLNDDLHRIDTNYNFEETSWNPTIIQRFVMAVNIEFKENFPYQGKLSWEMKKEENKPVLEASVRTEDFGSLSVQLPVDKIRSPKCPKNLPSQLISNFIKNFDKKSKK